MIVSRTLLLLLSLFSLAVDSRKFDVGLNFMTYNVMRGRYSCFQNQLTSNEEFRRLSNIKQISTRSDFVRTNLEHIGNFIRQYQPDIIALQEIQEFPSLIKTNDEISTATFLAERLNMSFTFSPTLFDSEVQMQYGTAVLVNRRRFEILSVEIVSLPLGLEPRNAPCLTIRSRSSNGTFRVCSIHFDHHPDDETVRFRQAQTLIQWSNKGHFYPTVLLGDFNSNRSSLTINHLYKYFFDDQTIENFIPTWSECGEPLKYKIDYILFDRRSPWTIRKFLHGSNMKKIFSTIDVNMLSDHVPLFAQTILSFDH